jgi:hypothetical protein
MKARMREPWIQQVPANRALRVKIRLVGRKAVYWQKSSKPKRKNQKKLMVCQYHAAQSTAT